MITLTELSQRTNIDTATLRRWCQTGKLPGTKYGKTWLVDETKIGDLKRDTRGRTMKTIDDLQDLTGHEAGAILYSDGAIWIGNWVGIPGIPRNLELVGAIGLGEDLSNARRVAAPAEAKAAMRDHEREQGDKPSYAGFRAWEVADVVVVVQNRWN